MNTKLLEFLIDKFTEREETVLDPMAGSGSTGVVASLHGRHAVQVDIEEKFYNWMEEAREKVEEQETLTPKGKIENVLGDARKLSELLKETDVVITSPPYSEGIGHDSGDNANAKFKERLEMQQRYTRQMVSEGNITRLKHGKVDTVITSPPFGSSTLAEGLRGRNLTKQKDFIGKQHRDYGDIGSKGDSSQIGNLPLGKVDAVITSPPYADGFRHNPQDKGKRLQKLVEVDKKGVEKGQKWGITSKEALERRLAMQDEGYGEKKENIGNLSFQPDAIITSPPYSQQLQARGGTQLKERMMKGNRPAPYSQTNKQNIGNLRHGKLVDVVVTSPPYAETAIQDYGTSNKVLLEFERQVRTSFRIQGFFEYNGKKYSEKEWRRINKGELKPRGIPELWATIISKRKQIRYNNENEENIGNLRFADVVITSPPYEGSLEGTSRHTRGGIASRDPALAQTGTYTTTLSKATKSGYSEFYSPSDENIGNLKKETYLEAMLKVYMEMYKVLKPNGKAIIVIKPFIRNKKVVDLPYHTWLLLKKVGFKLVKLYKLRLKNVSFWRVLYRKKYPSVPRISHEYVLVCEKVG